MIKTTHPNRYFVGQEVYFRMWDDAQWRTGVVFGVTLDERQARKRNGQSMAEEDHAEGCDGVFYVLANDTDGHLDRYNRDMVTECQCSVRIADTDPAGRWSGQLIEDHPTLALLLLDAKQRGDRITYTQVEVRNGPDELYIDANVGSEGPVSVTLARVRTDDLVAWASGAGKEADE